MEKNIISLIENDNHEEFVQQVFCNHFDGSKGNFYTIPLSVDEEKALIHRVATEKKNGNWYKALSDYISHYPLSNEAIDFLLVGIGNSLAIKVICSQFVKYGYTPEQGEKVCLLIQKDSKNKILLPLLPAVCKYGRIYDYDLYKLLCSIDERLRDQNAEKFGYADSYRKNVFNYRKQNGLPNYIS